MPTRASLSDRVNANCQSTCWAALIPRSMHERAIACWWLLFHPASCCCCCWELTGSDDNTKQSSCSSSISHQSLITASLLSSLHVTECRQRNYSRIVTSGMQLARQRSPKCHHKLCTPKGLTDCYLTVIFNVDPLGIKTSSKLSISCNRGRWKLSHSTLTGN